MELDPHICYRAVVSRDARFDGRFFTGVTSTGIYCRPTCPAPTPRMRNCRFYRCAAAAAADGLRPCRRCRPESAPGTPAWQGTAATVSRALRLIGSGVLDEGSVDDLAVRLGVGGRHLRRLFQQHLGATPVAVAQTRRLHFAKRLIEETPLPMAQVAMTAGYQSIRRFNAAIRRAYGGPPSVLRDRLRLSVVADAALTVRLPFRAPYDWERMARFLARRAIPGVEAVRPDAYRRTVQVADAHAVIEVRPRLDEHHFQLRIPVSLSSHLGWISERIRALFDLDADPMEISKQLAGDPFLRKRVRAHPGLRVPGAWDGFELGVRAILGQQVSVKGASTLAGRMVSTYGRVRDPAADADLRHLFPEPKRIARARLARIGLTSGRARAVRALARAVEREELQLDGAADPEVMKTRLLRLPGVGEWTAGYVAMRALRDPDALPAGDLGLRRALEVPARHLEGRCEGWRPWRAYGAMHVWTSEE